MRIFFAWWTVVFEDGFSTPSGLKLSHLDLIFFKMTFFRCCCCLFFCFVFVLFFNYRSCLKNVGTEFLTSSRVADQDKLNYQLFNIWDVMYERKINDIFSQKLESRFSWGCYEVHPYQHAYKWQSHLCQKRAQFIYFCTTSWGDCLFLSKNFGWRQNQQGQV